MGPSAGASKLEYGRYSEDGTLKYGVPIYVNQWVIFKYNIEPGDWKKGVMREPPKNYTTYEYRNEVARSEEVLISQQLGTARKFISTLMV